MMIFTIFLSLLQLSTYAKIVGVVEISRTGARAPVNRISIDNYDWPEGLNQILPEGQRQHYLIGTELRRRYIVKEQMLSPHYNSTEIRVTSPQEYALSSSAQSQLFGLFPYGPTLRDHENKDRAVPPSNQYNETFRNGMGSSALRKNLQPIPIHQVQESLDYKNWAWMTTLCPRMGEILSEQMNSSAYEEFKDDYYTFIAPQIEHDIGLYLTINQTIPYTDMLISDQYGGIAWPAGMTTGLYNEFIDIWAYQMNLRFTREGAILTSSEILKDVLALFDRIIDGTTTEKFYFYSTYSMTMLGIMHALDVLDDPNYFPIFASTLIIELHYVQLQYFVKVLVNDAEVLLGSCGDYMCFYDIAQKHIQNSIVEDIVTACKASEDIEFEEPIKFS